MCSEESSVRMNRDTYADSWFEKRRRNLGLLREEGVEAHRCLRSKIKCVYFPSHDSAASEVPGTNRWHTGTLRLSELFLVCSGDKGPPETRCFCSSVRGPEYRQALLEAVFTVEDLTCAFEFLRSRAPEEPSSLGPCGWLSQVSLCLWLRS